MARTISKEDDLSLSADKLIDHRPRNNRHHATDPAELCATVYADQIQHWTRRRPVAEQKRFSSLGWDQGIPMLLNLGNLRPGLFFDSLPHSPGQLDQRAPRSLRRPTLNNDEYHNSDGEDVYDLYNACNGAIQNGLLDKSKLDEYSPEDADALNVPRLRKIWEHTASGCSKCKGIIEALNIIRGIMSERITGPLGDQIQTGQIDQITSIGEHATERLTDQIPPLDIDQIDSIS